MFVILFMQQLHCCNSAVQLLSIYVVQAFSTVNWTSVVESDSSPLSCLM
jgi:hypothetical protein